MTQIKPLLTPKQLTMEGVKTTFVQNKNKTVTAKTKFNGKEYSATSSSERLASMRLSNVINEETMKSKVPTR